MATMYSAEPMMMGSPGGTPGSPPPLERSSFLPAYLMGEPAPSPSSPGPRMWSSSTGLAGSPPKSSLSRSSVMSPPQSQSFSTSRDLLSQRRADKPGGPPVAGLLESSQVNTPDDRSGYGTSGLFQSRFIQEASFAGTPSQGPPTESSIFSPAPSSHMLSGARKTPPSPAQVDPFYTQGDSLRPEDELDETWVTVFGFPPAATSFILQQFSQYGNIIKHVVATEGNWMHIHYQSKLQAKKALSKNAKIYGRIMVGVTQCIDKTVMDIDKENQNVHKTSIFGANQSLLQEDANTSRSHPPIRPLTAAYRAASSDHQVVPGTNIPKKNTGMLSKAVEYMFGW